MSTKTGRASQFVHRDGVEHTIEVLAAVIKPFSSILAKSGPDFYASIDFKSGVSTEALKKMETALASMMSIDPRGGIFNQAHLIEAIKRGMDQSDFTALTEHSLTEHDLTATECIDLMAYTLRVMCAHCRLLHDSCNDRKNHTLKDVFRKMNEEKTTGPPSMLEKPGGRTGSARGRIPS